MYPRALVRTFIPPFFLLRIPAWAVLILWFLSQALTGWRQLSTLRPEISGGVAVWAHIGGFVAGALLVRAFSRAEIVRRRTAVADAKAVWS
jgi:membrane associated rhomboid family serine protease